MPVAFPLASGTETDDIYQPLEDGQIRVLEILLRKDEEFITGNLKITNLDSPTAYNALSYVWGDLSKPGSNVIIDGKQLSVTENCLAALQELRREAFLKSQAQVIWIDAICINQNNIAERNQQVSHMGEIYMKAQKLIIWLGPQADNSDEAVEILRDLLELEDRGVLNTWIEGFIKHPRFHDRYCAILNLLARPWFQRLWIVQEFVLFIQFNTMDRVTFYCGEKRLLAAKLWRGTGFSPIVSGIEALIQCWGKIDQLEEIRELLSSCRKGQSCLMLLITYAISVPLPITRSMRARSLLSFVLNSSVFRCTVPHDRLYAQLGLLKTYPSSPSKDLWDLTDSFMSETSLEHINRRATHVQIELNCGNLDNAGATPNILIDYSAPIEDVYTSLTRYVISETKSLNILNLCGQRSNNTRPSWALDFQAFHPESDDLFKVIKMARSLLQDEDYEEKNGSRVPFNFSPDLEILSMVGSVYNTITDIYSELDNKSGPYLQRGLTSKVRTRCFLKNFERLRFFATEDEVLKAVWELMVADLVFEVHEDLYEA